MPEEPLHKKRISRRSLIKATGTALVLGSVSCQNRGSLSENASGQKPGQDFGCVSLPPIGDAKPRPKSLDFLSDEGFTNARLDGKAGFEIRLRVANYRSLPLDYILDFAVAVDGKEVRTEDITFLVDGHRYKVPELRNQKHVYWQTREYARLFIQREGGLSPGEHEVEVRMRKPSSPYAPPMLAFDTGKKRMTLESDV